jgi:hypothetical protein
LKVKAEGFQDRATALREESNHSHHIGDQYDRAELAVEFALVLCALAILSKQRGFWYAGIVFGILGIGVAVCGWFGWLLPH